jgi:hypothetical protein
VLAAAWIGTLPGWLTLLGLVGLALALRGGQLGPALGYLRDANRTLADENKALTAQIAVLVAENAKLHGRTDLAPLQAALLQQMKHHEDRAAERHTATLVVLDLIAAHLGPDLPNGARLAP